MAEEVPFEEGEEEILEGEGEVEGGEGEGEEEVREAEGEGEKGEEEEGKVIKLGGEDGPLLSLKKKKDRAKVSICEFVGMNALLQDFMTSLFFSFLHLSLTRTEIWSASECPRRGENSNSQGEVILSFYMKVAFPAFSFFLSLIQLFFHS